jgi:hypothetical protein
MRAPEEAGAALRRAVASGAAGEVQRCLDEYTAAVNAALAASRSGGRGAVETLGQALELLRWAGRVVRAQRAHAALELAQLSNRRRYLPSPPRPAGTFQLRG